MDNIIIKLRITLSVGSISESFEMDIPVKTYEFSKFMERFNFKNVINKMREGLKQ